MQWLRISNYDYVPRSATWSSRPTPRLWPNLHFTVTLCMAPEKVIARSFTKIMAEFWFDLFLFPTCQVRVVRFYVSCLLLSSSSCSTATLDAQCSLSDLNHDHPRPVFPAGPQPRPSPPSVPCRTSTTTIHAQCSLPDLNREYPRQVFPAGPHVGRYGTKNVQKKVRKNVRQVCYILLANSRVCGRVTGAMPLLTLQVAKFEAISLNR